MQFYETAQTASLDFEEVTELLEPVVDGKVIRDTVTSSGCRFCSRWSERENIILCGIVLDTYYSRHSLKPCNYEKRQAKMNGIPVKTLIWSQIQNKYTTACKRIAIITGKEIVMRTTNALQKRWKDLGKEQRETPIRSNNCISMTKQRLKIWDDIYNCDNVLLGSEENFRNKAWGCTEHILSYESCNT